MRTVGICGLGMVGGSMRKYYKDAYVYDKYKEEGSIEELNKADIIFICVPTPYQEGGFDTSEIKNALDGIENDKIVVLRSTMLPGTTVKLQKQYPRLKLLFNPEFLTEESAMSDFQYPDKQIVGFTDESYKVAGDVMGVLPLAPYTRIMRSYNAEMIKIMLNTYFCVKVTYANHIYDICKSKKLDYNIVKEAFVADKRVNDSHFEIFHKGFRGYSGKCLPKDSKALIDFSPMEEKWLKEMDKFNSELLNG